MREFVKSIEIFEKYAKEYDDWFEKNKYVYKSEIKALKKLSPPKNSKALEIGVGTGRFAEPLGIKIGVEPSKAMADFARKRGIEVYEAKAENLPFNNSSFDSIFIIVTICFVENPIKVLTEAKRVLKRNGNIIIGIIDKNSFLGKIYELKKKENKFYRNAKFYSIDEVLNWLLKLGFYDIKTFQTIFKDPEKINSIEP
jgi:ubiquinone/menaquinone biosynthesis C-methylase UbiE